MGQFTIDFLDDGRVLDMLHKMHGLVKKLDLNLSELPDWPYVRAGSEFLDLVARGSISLQSRSVVGKDNSEWSSSFA